METFLLTCRHPPPTARPSSSVIVTRACWLSTRGLASKLTLNVRLLLVFGATGIVMEMAHRPSNFLEASAEGASVSKITRLKTAAAARFDRSRSEERRVGQEG